MKTVATICEELQRELTTREQSVIPKPLRIHRNGHYDYHLPSNSINVLKAEKSRLLKNYLAKDAALDKVINKLRENNA